MIPAAPLIFRFRAEAQLRASFPEAAWRGAFGFALKRTVCAMRLRACDGCPLEFSCPYPRLFETRPAPGAPARHGSDRDVHPYVLRHGSPAPGDSRAISLVLTLIGRALGDLPYVVRALEDAGRRGLGPDRVGLTLQKVEAIDGQPIWSPGEPLRSPTLASSHLDETPPRQLDISFETPMRLVRDGKPITPEALDGPTLAFAAVRRVGLLRAAFSEEPDPGDYAELRRQAEGVQILRSDLGWVDRRRYSARQKRPITLGGLIGRLRLDLSEAPALAPYLITCETVHLGKACTLGFGKIALAPA